MRSRSGVATLPTAIHLLLSYLLTFPARPCGRVINAMRRMLNQICVSVTSRCLLKLVNGLSWFCGTLASLDFPYTALQRKLISPTTWKLPFETLTLEKCRHCTSTAASVVNLVRPTTVDSLSYHTERPPLCTTQWA